MTNLSLLKPAVLTRNVNNIIKTNDTNHIQEVLVNVIYQAFQGNYNPLISLADSEVSGIIRGYVGKYSPVVRVKDTKSYNFSMPKAQRLMELFVFESTKPSFDEIASKLPMWKQPKEAKKAAPVDAIASVKRLITKLENATQEATLKEGTENSAQVVLEALKKLDI